MTTANTLNVGLNCHLYLNTATYSSPTWVEITTVKDANLDIEATKADASARRSKFKQFLKALISGPISFKMVADSAESAYDTLRDASVSTSTTLDVAIASDLIASTGTEYFRGDFFVFGFKRAEPLEDVATVDVALDLAYSSHVPGFTTVGS